MRKICHMTSAHGKEDNRIFHKECISLAENGYDVYLVQRGESYEKNGVHIIGAGEIPKARYQRMTKGAKKVYQIGKSLDCDLYHIHDPELLPYGVKLKKQGKKVVFDSHEFYREQLKGKTKAGPIISRIYTIYEKSALRKIDGLVFPCSIQGRNPFDNMCNHFAYINNVPRLSELYNEYEVNSEKYERSICYIGTISESRGITNIIKAASLSNTVLYLAGVCHNSNYMAEIQKMPEYEHVRYLGVLDRDGIKDLLSHIQVGMATLLNVGQYYMADNMPTKAYEYMAMGIPVVLSNTPYNCTLNNELNFGIVVDSSQPKAIADAINSILSDRVEYSSISENGRNAIATMFNWEKESLKLLELYESIFNN